MLKQEIVLNDEQLNNEKKKEENGGRLQHVKEDEKIKGPDERLRKYGVLENTAKSATSLFEEYMKQNKPEANAAVKELLEEVRQICNTVPSERNAALAKNCEKVLAEYLATMAYKVNEKFYMTLITFIRLYKDCMDEYGWGLLTKYKSVPEEEKVKIFTKTKDAEHIPEACNLFMNKFFLKEFPNFDPAIAMDLTLHFCEWLYSKEYTHSRISQLN